jgi:hypothetical protein
MESKKKNGSVLCSRMLPFFQNPLGRKIIVPRADHAIRWAMQPGAPASRNRARNIPILCVFIIIVKF